MRESPAVGVACEKAGVTRQAAYHLRASDPEFREAWESALQDSIDTLKQSAFTRARDGVGRLKFGADGEALIDPRTLQPYEERQYSDKLTELFLKAYEPETFRDTPTVVVNVLNQFLEQQAEQLGLESDNFIEGAYRFLAGESILPAASEIRAASEFGESEDGESNAESS